MHKRDELEALIKEYQKSIIQSEAEVRSKFIVPLLDFLEYPSELRAEEYPVYGFEGGKKIPAKDADFIMFSDKNFGNYRTFVQKNIEWVQNNSLLVVEAKKPGEMPVILGQPVYYTIWTKAVAYLVTDGESIKGYFYNDITSDKEIIDCKICDLLDNKEIWNFSYQNIESIKKNGIAACDTDDIRIMKQVVAEMNDDCVILTSDDEINLPEETLDYMKYALGRNANNLGKLELVSTFLNMTDMYLQCKLRYDIPAYMFDFPRENYSAYLYINNIVLPLIKGEVLIFYWNDYEKYLFTSEYIEAIIIYEKGILKGFEIGYHVLDCQVSARLSSFEVVKKCMLADIIHIQIADSEHRSIFLPTGTTHSMWESKDYVVSMMHFWIAGLEKMKIIEDYYDFKFYLKQVHGQENLNELYDAIDFVYDGIVMNQNCEITIPGGFSDDDFELTEPIICQENTEIPLKNRVIQGVTFKPYRSALLPGTIHVSGTTNNDTIKINGCCLYMKYDDEKQEIGVG